MDTMDEAVLRGPLIAVGPHQRLTEFGHGVAVSERHRLLVASSCDGCGRCALDVYALSAEPLRDPVPFALVRVIRFDSTDEPLSFTDLTTSTGGHLAFVPGPVAQVVVTEPGKACVGVVDVKAAARLPYVAPPGTLACARRVAVNDTGSRVAITQTRFRVDHGVSPDAIVVYGNQGTAGWAKLAVWEDTTMSGYLSGIRWLPGAGSLGGFVTVVTRMQRFGHQVYVRHMRTSGATVKAGSARLWNWDTDVRDVEIVGEALVLVNPRAASRLRLQGHDTGTAVSVVGGRSVGDSGVLSLAYLSGVGAFVVRSGYHVELLATRDAIGMACMSDIRVAWMRAVVSMMPSSGFVEEGQLEFPASTSPY
jgi:hypothetical protein